MNAALVHSVHVCPRWARIRSAAAARRDRYPRQFCAERAQLVSLIAVLDTANALRRRSPQLSRELLSGALAWARMLNLHA